MLADGVLGVLAGTIGTLQATEAIKFLLGQGDLLVNSLLIYDALTANFRRAPLTRNPACPLCGETPTITELRDSALSGTGDSGVCARGSAAQPPPTCGF